MAGSDRRRAFMAQWLAGKLAPGDRLVAGVGAITGPNPYVELLPLVTATVALISSYARLSGPVLIVTGALGLGGAVLGLALIGHRKFIYLAVTERQLLAVHMRGRRKPVGVLFSTPLGTTRLTTKRSGPLPYLHMVCCASAAGGISVGGKTRDSVRLTVRGHRGQLADVLNAVRLQGGAVDPPVLTAPASIRQ